jgi:hypothetical protein
MTALAHYGAYAEDTNGSWHDEGIYIFTQDPTSWTSLGQPNQWANTINQLGGHNATLTSSIPIPTNKLEIVNPCVPKGTCPNTAKAARAKVAHATTAHAKAAHAKAAHAKAAHAKAARAKAARAKAARAKAARAKAARAKAARAKAARAKAARAKAARAKAAKKHAKHHRHHRHRRRPSRARYL